jgi:hypothetical protein
VHFDLLLQPNSSSQVVLLLLQLLQQTPIFEMFFRLYKIFLFVVFTFAVFAAAAPNGGGDSCSNGSPSCCNTVGAVSIFLYTTTRFDRPFDRPVLLRLVSSSLSWAFPFRTSRLSLVWAAPRSPSVLVAAPAVNKLFAALTTKW